jgi:hypothetical protein
MTSFKLAAFKLNFLLPFSFSDLKVSVKANIAFSLGIVGSVVS